MSCGVVPPACQSRPASFDEILEPVRLAGSAVTDEDLRQARDEAHRNAAVDRCQTMMLSDWIAKFWPRFLG